MHMWQSVLWGLLTVVLLQDIFASIISMIVTCMFFATLNKIDVPSIANCFQANNLYNNLLKLIQLKVHTHEEYMKSPCILMARAVDRSKLFSSVQHFNSQIKSLNLPTTGARQIAHSFMEKQQIEQNACPQPNMLT